MSSPIDKLALLPSSIPITFQLPGGPIWTAEFLSAPTLAKTQVSYNGTIFNLQHFINHYQRHVAQRIDLHLPSRATLDCLKNFTVAQGKGSTDTILHHLEHTSNLKDVGCSDPIVSYIKQKFTEVDEAVDAAAKAAIVVTLFNYIRELGLTFVKANQKLMEVMIAKCHQFRKEEHIRFPELEKACRLLLIDLGQVPPPLLTPEQTVRKNWAALPCAFLCVTLQMGSGPVEHGILHPRTGLVSTAFYQQEVPLAHWFNKYRKEYNPPSRPRTFLNRLIYLMSGPVNFYEMLFKNTAKEHLVLASDEDEDKLVQKRICRFSPEKCQCDLHRPLEPPCECYGCRSIADLQNEINELRARLAALEKK
jgi:hypothetical protein